MTDIDRIIANCRRDSRTVSGSERRALCDEIERLRAIVGRLPKTSDGVPVLPGDRMFCRCGMGPAKEVLVPPQAPIDSVFPGCYSTREAAEAARE